MPDIIKLLPDSVANQIAAGEVIQRPASLVKELTENAIDAGASAIKVVIKDSGRTLVQVIDDGIGMSETDARLSFERHATSKISDALDLFHITTKGFRGEALASIAAVAMVELRTRRKTDETGTLIEINGSKIVRHEPCSCQQGSVFTVKNLFYNIPARRKFLKSDATEFRHILSEFQKTAIAHPSIRFSLFHNDTEIYSLQPGNLRQRIVGLFGKAANQDLIDIETDTSLVKISGFVGKPENARRSSGEQFFFANNRFMRHPYFHKAVMEAYQNIIPPDVVPSYFIFLEVDPATVDINIHPTKTEIKFEDERSIWQIIMAAVRESLGRFNIVPSIDFEGEPMVDIPVFGKSAGLPPQPSIQVNRAFNPFDTDFDNSNFRNSGKTEREPTAHWEQLFGTTPDSERNEDTEPAEGGQRKIIQVRGRYLICPVKSGLMIIDQRMAHERILFEKLLSLSAGNQTVSQSTMFPETVTLTDDEMAVYATIANDLARLGFDIRGGKGNDLLLHGYPEDAATSNPVAILKNLIAVYGTESSDPASGKQEKVCRAMSAAAAINYGKQLSRQEMELLFDMLFACSSPNYSPSGKPVVTILSVEEIDKKFR
jgi:DNA mismatch repair protein MutL